MAVVPIPLKDFGSYLLLTKTAVIWFLQRARAADNERYCSLSITYDKASRQADYSHLLRKKQSVWDLGDLGLKLILQEEFVSLY